MFNNQVAGTITAEGRELTRTMSDDNEHYWYHLWHEDKELHKEMFIKDVEQIPEGSVVSVYGDSITGNSILKTNDGDISIEELYTMCSKKSNRTDKEVVKCDSSSLNWTLEKGIHLSKIKNVIKHKVSKKMWKIKVGGNELILTNDHSLIIFRNGIKIKVKPSEVTGTDKILICKENNPSKKTYNEKLLEKVYEIVEIDSIEEIGNFDNEYVYDLEMEDESHTFIANNILIHNTDSLFVGFQPAITSCNWQNNIFNKVWMDKCPYPFTIITDEELRFDINNPNCKEILIFDDKTKDSFIKNGININTKLLIVSGHLIKSWDLNPLIEKYEGKIFYNWANELEFIQGLDHYRISGYFKKRLDEHAKKYGVENAQDFELEKISESIINLEKKKYIQHIIWEDGIEHDRFTYFQPKGVELVRSSTPQFARDPDMGIYRIVKYLFNNPDDFNIRELIGIVRDMRREFELADVNDISGQSSCSKYEEKVLNDKTGLDFVTGAHFAVKAAAFHNYLLHQRKELQTRYEFLRSGDKIKYYYTTSNEHPIFAFKRGEFPIEYAPEVDYDVQFDKVILSPINAIIKKLDMPEINKRLSVIMDIFSSI